MKRVGPELYVEPVDLLSELAIALESLDVIDRTSFFTQLIDVAKRMPSYDPARRIQTRVEAAWERRGHIGPSTELKGIAPGSYFTVYYVRFAHRVKIGYTASLRQRLRNIPFDEFLATEPGGPEVEARRHAEFADLREVGEWFRYEEPLRSHIESLQP